MYHSILPPEKPNQDDPARPPMVYVEKPLQWEYKQVFRDLDHESLLNEAELNELGKDSWEMSGIAQQQTKVIYYFKRLFEN